MKKEIPPFQSEAEERRFWQQHDSSEYIDWSDAEEVLFPELKPSTETVLIRLPVSMLHELKMLANQRDISCPSLLKIFLAERIQVEQAHRRVSKKTSLTASPAV